MIKKNIPTYQTCSNIVMWIKSNQPLQLTASSLHQLFLQKKDTKLHPTRFILKNLYRNALSELNDDAYAAKLYDLFHSLQPSKLNKIDHSLVHDMISYSQAKNFVACAKVIQSIFTALAQQPIVTSDVSSEVSSISDHSMYMDTTSEASTDSSSSNHHINIETFKEHLMANGQCPQQYLSDFINDFKTTNITAETYAKNISLVPHCLFHESITVTTVPEQNWPILHIFANLTTSEARAQKLNAICNHLGSNNVLEVLKQYNVYRDDTGYNLIQDNLKDIVMPEITGLSLTR